MKLNPELVDIILLAAEGGRQRERDGPRPGVDAGAEQRREFGTGLRHQGNAVVLADARRRQTIGHRQRIFAHFGKGIGAFERAAHIVKIKPFFAARSVIDRLVERGEIRAATRQGAVVRRRRQGGVGHC